MEQKPFDWGPGGYPHAAMVKHHEYHAQLHKSYAKMAADAGDHHMARHHEKQAASHQDDADWNKKQAGTTLSTDVPQESMALLAKKLARKLNGG